MYVHYIVGYLWIALDIIKLLRYLWNLKLVQKVRLVQL